MAAPPSNRPFVGVVIGVVLAAIAAGLWVVGPPSEARLRRFDDRRIEDLRQLSAAVEMYARRHKRLPPSLEEVAAEPSANIDVKDPVTGEAYVYHQVSATSYELCAVFARPADNEASRWPGDPWWKHSAGRYCFQLPMPTT